MNKYEIIKDVGGGTYGEVYEAINKITNQKVAIKKLKQKIDSWDKCMNQNEVYFLRNLNHPNIIKLLEVIREKNSDISLVFEYCDFNLYELIKTYKRKQMQLPESKIQNIIYNITLGLSYIHSQNIMHRDLKPENILILDNEIKIGDFGTAKEIPKYNDNSLTDYICTRWYRAPECVLKSKNYNEKVDIWALGCIMAELYNLKPLFPGQSEFDQIEKMFQILGTPDYEEWKEGYELIKQLNFKFPKYDKINLINLFYEISKEAIDFMEQIFQYDDKKRPSADELLNHPYLKNFIINRENNHYDSYSYRKLNRNLFRKDNNYFNNDYNNIFNIKTNNNNYKVNNRRIILPEIRKYINNKINNDNDNATFKLQNHRINSLIKDNNNYDYFLQKNYFNNRFNDYNKNNNNSYLNEKYRNSIIEEKNINSNSFIYSNYIKNNKQQQQDYINEENRNPFSTMANDIILHKKNFFFDNYNYMKNEGYNNDEGFNNMSQKMKRYKSNYNLNSKYKNFGYNYFPDGNYRSIFSIK